MYQSSDSNRNNTSQNLNTPVEETFDLKVIIDKVVSNWLLYCLCILVCFTIAVLYASYSSPVWHIKSKILINNDSDNSQSVLGGGMNGSISSLFSPKSSADNELQVLRSRTLMEKTVAAMQLNVKTYLVDGLKSREIYNESPFIINVISKVDTVLERTYVIDVQSNTSVRITNGDEDIDITSEFGRNINLPQHTLVIKRRNGFPLAKQYKLKIQATDATVDDFSKILSAELSDKQATTIDLSIEYYHPAKGEAILNKLMQLYLLSNLQNEKQIADSTIAFIESRINLVSKELNNIEKQFEIYKSQNKIANISEQSKSLVTSASGYYDKLAEQDIQLNIINDLERNLSNPKNKNIIPSSLVNSSDQALAAAINSYNELLINRDRSTLSLTDDNPILLNIDKQINNARINILKSISSYKESLQIGKKQLQKQNQNLTGQIKELPNKERNYLDFARQQNLKQELYLFLLQKREETAISKNSTLSNARILDTAKSEFKPSKPRKSIVWLVGIIVGVLLPSLYLIIKSLTKTRIESKIDIEHETSVPILAEIGHNSDKNSLVTGSNSRSVISEQFRSLRTNLQFILESSKSNVLLFTSSMSGEGKSFLSLNIGSALALTGKKVVFMEMDLRKPKLSESLGLTIDNGYTQYAISDDEKYDYKKLLKSLSFNSNCYLISSGPIPPNPAELLETRKLDELMSYLRANFDYVIIDCAPIGLVTDAQMLERHADLTLYVTRERYTYKSQLSIVDDLYVNKKVKKVYIIINDVKMNKTGYSSYKQAYGYGIEEEGVMSKLKFWNRNK
ncbi:GumC family protein [Mucilaginibacter aquatilis]|uniref:non-specific protein-tyrosine kinase n=1 Tax=Mucilaginibacter aquatilis TaxID=1517760 RepID=A0A6I4I814_9SPHI|nr:polysaccharide biosynthesis tyrosine autokinase [Mucilaginibacter aquatilis]MVN91192.1 polysaccharide biosynthesis tyrosine autokinase [Mucilaginibacter aquatilis]